MAIQSLDALAQAVHRLDRLGDLRQSMVRFAEARGVVRIAFHANPSPFQSGAAPAIWAQGFPNDWVAHYLAEDLVLNDPIPALAARRSKPFFWGDTASLMRLTGAEEEVLRHLETADLGDGLAMQVHGPGMRSAYVGVGFGGRRPDLSEGQIFELKAGAQIIYLRYCDLTEATYAMERDLSPREAEILGWVARGKSNAVIGEILGVSRHTVDTNLRRLFEKLDATDRTTAALRGIGAGVISPGAGPVPRVRDKT